MKTTAIKIIIFSIIFSLLGCQLNTWERFNSPEGDFSISFPGNPDYKKYISNTATGPLDIHVFSLENSGVAYSIGYSDYEESIIQQNTPDYILDNIRDGSVTGGQGKLLTEIIISLGEYPGREIRIKSPDGKMTIKSRIYLVGNRAYILGVVTTKEKSYLRKINEFLDSFNLVGK